jgi:hypothetical protein
MRELDGEDDPTVIIKDWVVRDITTPPIVEREVGPPPFVVAADEDGTLSEPSAPAPRPAAAWWPLAASAAVAALVTAVVLALR